MRSVSVFAVWFALLPLAFLADVALGMPIDEATMATLTNAAAQGIAQSEAANGPAATTGAMSPVGKAAIAAAVAAVTVGFMIEALGAAAFAVPALISEAPALAVALGAAAATPGGMVAMVVAIAVIGTVITISLGLGVPVTLYGLQKTAEGINATHPTARAGQGQTGEQTDFSAPNPVTGQVDLHVDIDPVTGVLRSFSIPGGHPPGVADEVSEAVGGVVTGCCTTGPGLGLSLTLGQLTNNPNTVASDLTNTLPDPGSIFGDPPGTGVPGPDVSCCDDGGMGLMAVVNPGPDDRAAVPSLPTWLMTLVGLGLGAWAFQRRAA